VRERPTPNPLIFGFSRFGHIGHRKAKGPVSVGTETGPCCLNQTCARQSANPQRVNDRLSARGFKIPTIQVAGELAAARSDCCRALRNLGRRESRVS